MNDRRRLKLTTAYLFAFMASFALSSTMFSTVLPKMIEDFHLSLSMAGLLPMCTSVGNLIAMALTGLVGDRTRKSVFVGLISAAMGVMLLAVSPASSFAMLLAALLLLGVCTSSLNLMLTAYVSDIYGERRSRYINLLHVCFGIGSLVGPLYPTALGAADLSWRFAYMMLAVVVLILSAAYFLTLRRLGAPVSFADANASAAPKEAGGTMGLLRSSSVWVLGIVSFLYMGGHQNAFSTWFQTHLQQANAALYPESLTSACMTIYWIGMVISRLIGSALPQKFSSRSIILTASLAGVCALSGGLAIDAPAGWVVSVSLLGIATGVIYPLTFAISCAWFPSNSALVSSIVGVFSSLGSILFGYLMGFMEELYPSVALWLPVAALLSVFVIVLLFMKNPQTTDIPKTPERTEQP